MRHAWLLAIFAAGCGSSTARIEIRLRVPAGDTPLRFADAVTLTLRDAGGQLLSLRRAPSSAAELTLDPVPAGSGYQVELDATLGTDPVARGRSCPFDVPPGGPAPTVPVYFSRVGRFAPTGPPSVARTGAAAFAIDRGALVAGGATTGGALDSSEQYDQSTGRFSDGPRLTTPRAFAAAAPLGNGTALILGGAAANAPGVEAFAMGQMAAVPSTFPADWIDGATVSLADGRVLVLGGRHAGGAPSPTAFVFSMGGAMLTSSTALARARARHTVTLAGPVALFVIGGLGADGPVADIELFEPNGATSTLIGAQLGVPRYDHSATRLDDGRILVAGGRGADGVPLASAEIFDPATRRLAPAGSLRTARALHTVTPLLSGRLLLAGGAGTDGTPLASAEIFDPALGENGDFVPTAPLSDARAGHAALPLCDGTTLLVGGGAGAEIYNP
jgi:hypothetical protein